MPYSIADNLDGTATVTVTGAVGAWTLYLIPAANPLGGAWVAAATDGSDSSQSFNVSTGGYWAALADDNGWTTPQFFLAAAATPSPWERFLAAVVARIQALGLSGLDPTRVEETKVPLNQYLARRIASNDKTASKIDGRPAIVVAVQTEVNLPGKGQVRGVGYRALVGITWGSNHDRKSNLGAHLTWRKQISDSFYNKPMPEVAEIYQTTVLPNEIFSFAAWKSMFDAQSLIVQGNSCEVAA